jgi:hypothetical protein
MHKIIISMILLSVLVVGCDSQIKKNQPENIKEKVSISNKQADSDEKPAESPRQENDKLKGFDLDGFKNIKFGMKSEELKKLGFSCDNSFYCNKIKNGSNYTLLGREANMSTVSIKDDSVRSIAVSIDSMSAIEVIDIFKKSLGNPIQYEFYTSNIISSYLWVSSNNTSINVAVNTVAPYNYQITYNNEDATLNWLSRANVWKAQKIKDTATPNPKDF